MTPQMVFAFNHPSRKAAIYSELDDQGMVTFAIQAARDSPIRGTELFRRMLLAFGDEAVAILGAWTKGTEQSINIDKVNELTKAGIALEESILHTWTVTRAKKMGFNKVKVIGAPEGSAGAYSHIEVLIEK